MKKVPVFLLSFMFSLMVTRSYSQIYYYPASGGNGTYNTGTTNASASGSQPGFLSVSTSAGTVTWQVSKNTALNPRGATIFINSSKGTVTLQINQDGTNWSDPGSGGKTNLDCSTFKITGPNSLADNVNTYNFNSSYVPGGSYSWMVTGGGSIVSGQGTPSISTSIPWNNIDNVTISVSVTSSKYYDGCGATFTVYSL